MIILWGFLVYLWFGAFALCAFDISTKRIRRKFSRSGLKVQEMAAGTGSGVGRKTSLAILFGVIWLLWPVVFVGAATHGEE